MKKPIISFIVFFVYMCNLFAQNNVFVPITKPDQLLVHEVEGAAFYQINYNALFDILSIAPFEFSQQAKPVSLQMPIENGNFVEVKVFLSPIFENGLLEHFPTFKTFSLQGLTPGVLSGRADYTEKGFQAILHTTNNTWYFDQVAKGSNTILMVYSRAQYYEQRNKSAKSKNCLNQDDLLPTLGEPIQLNPQQNFIQKLTGNTLRTYRTAIAATGEYTAFHGGTVAAAMSAIVTTTNRVNAVYERDLAIRFVLVANNHLVVYTNPATDPFSNNNAQQILSQNQTNMDNVIGSSNYDLGHVFATQTSGLAGLRVVCSASRKAQGVTGIASPIGDPFDIDYVAHEIGHQFGGNHTFNASAGSCGSNRNATTAYEPGSGTTIMAYAGLCGNQNVQTFSNDYFHFASLNEMYNFAYLGSGNNCAARTPTANNPPVAMAPQSGFTIPINTPFRLVGSGTDLDTDQLTYTWEQFDLGPAGDPAAPAGNAPLFRSFLPSTSPARYFPRFQNLINNSNSIGEMLPNTTRNLNFRFTVRDNRVGGGGFNTANLSFASTALAGPFMITAPSAGQTLQSGSFVNITWNVANTHVAPVNCRFVNVYISYDGGLTFVDTLATNLPNNGSTWVRLPDTKAGNQCRLYLEAADNVFFDVSRANFTVNLRSNPDFETTVLSNNLAVCELDTLVFPIAINGIAGFNDTVFVEINQVPAGLSVSLSDSLALPNAIITCTVFGAIPNGPFNLNLMASALQVTKNANIRIDGGQSLVASPTQLIPNRGEVVSKRVSITWAAMQGATNYRLEVFNNPNLTTTVFNRLVSDTFAVLPLLSQTNYWWRVQAINNCGFGPFSDTLGFSTAEVACHTYSNNAVLPISSFGAPVVVSRIQVLEDGIIESIKINRVHGTHTQVSDLRFRLIGPDSTTVILMNRICGSSQNFDLGFDDLALASNIPCPPTNGNLYNPAELLSAFANKLVYGTWTLEVADLASQNGGLLRGWSIEFCLSKCTNESVQVGFVSPQTTFCQGDSISIQSSASASNNGILRFLWSINGQPLINQNASILYLPNITTTGLYQVKAYTACGSDSAQLPIIVNMIPSAPNILHNGNVLSASQGFVKYVWFFNNIMLPDTTQTIIATAVGQYAVSGKDSNGCSSAFSASFLFDPTNLIIANNQLKFAVLPNPISNNELLKITLDASINKWISCSIFDIQGKLMRTFTINGNTQTHLLDLSDLNAGIYLLSLSTVNEQKYVQKLIKK